VVRQELLKQIAASEAKIIETEESTIFSQTYKDQTISQEKAFITERKHDIAGYDRVMDQSKK
jgi:hypothetical protein